MTIENDFKVNKWNDSYDRGENNILYPQPEIVKFLNRFIKKKLTTLEILKILWPITLKN